MNKQTLAIIVAALVVLGGVYLFFIKDGSKSDATENIVMEDGVVQNGDNVNTDQSKKMAFKEFIKQGGAYVCTVNQSVQNVESQGTIYTDGANVRGEFKTQIQGTNMDTNFIVKDGYSYSWSSVMANIGYKIPAEGNTAAGGGVTAGTYSFNAEEIGDYNCEAWNVDKSKFEIPASIKFTEIKY